MADTVKALVLAGGGAKGSYQVGVYKALRELGWRPDIITGASVGSLNGILFTLDKADEAEQLWLSLDDRDVIALPEGRSADEVRRFVLDTFRGGGLALTPLGEVIRSIVDEGAVRRAPVRYGLVMTRMEDLQSVHCPIDAIPEGRLWEYMLASSACFPALRPQEIDGVKYIDGGWRDNMPLDLAAQMGAAELLGVDIEGIGVTRPNDTGLPTRILKSHWDLGPILDFDGVRAKRNIALGYQDTMRAFGRYGGTAYALQPDTDGFATRFIAGYLAALDRMAARVPTLLLTESLARQTAGYPAPFSADPTAVTRAAMAPLELAAERLDTPPDTPYTPRALAEALLARAAESEHEPAQRFAALFVPEAEWEEAPAVAAAAVAAAEPGAFVTALAAEAAKQTL